MKKRVLALLLAVVMCLAMAAPAFAEEQLVGDFLIDGNKLVKYYGDGGAVTIPDNITIIGDYAFQNYAEPISVTIPSSVTTIGEGAFIACSGLTSVTIPNSVTTVGQIAFADCDSLTSVTIPSSLTSIEERMFYSCDSLASVTIPNSVTTIKDEAFSFCESLTDVTLPNSITDIGRDAFLGCNLVSVTIPNGVTALKSGVFAMCRSLVDVTIPDGVTIIEAPHGGFGAFQGCKSLTSVTIPSSVTGIGNFTFSDCTGLTTVTIPSSAGFMVSEVFGSCTNLTDVYYGGSSAQWKMNGGEMLMKSTKSNATVHYNSTGPSTPTTPTQPTNPTPSTNLPTVENIAPTGTAVARTQTVKLDGKDVQFQCYAVKDANGNESNYVKIRDLALALNGTKAQFNVGWNGKISITSSTAYQAAGGEGTTPYSGSQSYKAVSNVAVSFNGSDVNLTSFSITHQGGGYTYYKLRDLGQLLGFNVKWDNSAKSMVIETDKPYTGN